MSAISPDALGRCPQCGADHPSTVLRCPDTDVMLPLGGRLLDGRFRLLECIGRGGMASVWLALNERVDRRVAIKLIRPDVARDDDMVARFRGEARSAGRIGHPNICDILDSGRSPIGPYIVMELLEGPSLGDVLAGGARLEPGVAVMLVREALRGLKAAHRAGIVHRDLKPENIFLHRPEGGTPIVKLMDFGVAKFTDGSGEARTEHGALLGTPEYMAPEQFRGAAFAEPRTDIWAIGAILYRALTGRNAFGGPTVAATLIMVATEEPPSVTELAPHTPGGLADVVARCLLKQPDGRFADVADLDAALAPYDLPERDISVWGRAGAVESIPANAAPGGSASTRVWSADEQREVIGTLRRGRVAIGFVLASIVGLVAWQFRATSSADGDAADSANEAIAEPSAPIPEPVAPTTEPVALAVAPDGPSQPDPPLPDAPLPEPDPPVLAIRPAVPPPPPPPDDVVVVVLEPEIDDAAARSTELPPPDPAGVVRQGRWVALTKAGPAAPLRTATEYCEKLASAGHLGIRRWEVPNPAIAAKFASTKGIRKGHYWTTALWRGKALSIAMPSGDTRSIAATNRKPRTLCVARWP